MGFQPYSGATQIVFNEISVANLVAVLTLTLGVNGFLSN